MTRRENSFGQPIGEVVAGWNGVEPPSRRVMEGRFCRIEALCVDRHLDELFDAFAEDSEGILWTYMPDGPFASVDELRAWIEPACKTDDPLFHALIDVSTGQAAGIAAYMRIKPAFGAIEVGNIAWSPRVQRTAMVTEAMYLMMKRVFSELGYRRYEWKCDSLNESSRRAAERLGFSFDGIFEQALVYKSRNRDTAWYSILDRDWPPIERAMVNWLAPGNFGTDGQQLRRLAEFMDAER